MKSWIGLLVISVFATVACDRSEEIAQLRTPFEQSDSLETTTYQDCIEWWKKLEAASPHICLQKIGETDAMRPLHLAVFNASGNFSLEKIRESKKTVWLINNGIHPGEADGIDATMLFFRDLAASEALQEQLDSVVIIAIPIYNVGGALNRNSTTRTNQDGPLAYGFRGNARDLDLNRDFIKADSRNAQTFQQIFTNCNPDIYLETHVSNGADYAYTMTYLLSQADKMTEPLGTFCRTKLAPALEQTMTEQNDPMTPYVNVFGTTPDKGWEAFLDSPRYSTGYAALFQSIGLLTETHMLKPFKQRVASTHRFMHALASWLGENHSGVKSTRMAAIKSLEKQSEFPLNWTADKSKPTVLEFNGYNALYDSSSVTHLPQLRYDRSQPKSMKVPYYNRFVPTSTAVKPSAYAIPAGWEELIEALERNGVVLERIEEDTTLVVLQKHITDYKTVDQPYEGHYLHYNTKTKSAQAEVKILGGSYYLAHTNQRAVRFLIETLEPEAPDSYFNWNFFDEVLQQKEWFSSYVFEPEAKRLLEADPDLNTRFRARQKADSTFAASAFQQLRFIHQNSVHYEKEHLRYPVFRIE